MFLKTIMHVLSLKQLLLPQAGLFLLLNILDGHSTWLVLKPDNYSRERNPIARWVFRKLHIPGAIIIYKAAILGFLGVFISYWWMEALTINIALLIGNILFILVVLHNYKVSRCYKKHQVSLAKYLSDISK